jgi:hypothetical protein
VVVGATVVVVAATVGTVAPLEATVVAGATSSVDPAGATTGLVTTGAAVDCDAATVEVGAEATVVVDAATVVVVTGATVVVVAGASTMENDSDLVSASRRRWVGAEALRVQVPVETAVSAPVEGFTVQTEVVLDVYVTPWPAGSVDPEVTGNVVVPVRCSGVEP